MSRLRGAFSIDVSILRADPDQPRRVFPEDELAQLADSIRERGIRQPIRVWYVAKDNVFQIISGERRFRAATAAGLAAIPCVVDEPPKGAASPERKEVLVDQIVENWQREDLNPYDLSDALKELRDRHGLSQDEIARITGKPKSEISRFLAMQRVSPEVQTKIRHDATQRFSRRHVVAVAKLPPDAQQAMAARILDEGLTATQTERAVARIEKRRTGRDTRGAQLTKREYLVGSTRVKMFFRKRIVSTADVLEVVDRVRAMVERQDSEPAE